MSDNIGSGPALRVGMNNPYLEEDYRKRFEAKYTETIKSASNQLRDIRDAHILDSLAVHAEAIEDAKDLANDHWGYIKALLEAHGEVPDEIHRIGFHYKSAFIHGYKHALEDLDER